MNTQSFFNREEKLMFCIDTLKECTHCTHAGANAPDDSLPVYMNTL